MNATYEGSMDDSSLQEGEEAKVGHTKKQKQSKI